MYRRILPHLALLLALALLASGCGEAGQYIKQAVDLAEQIGRTAEGVSKTSEALTKTAKPWLADEQGVSPFGTEAVDTVELDGITVTVKECTISSGNVKCTFLFELASSAPNTGFIFDVIRAFGMVGKEFNPRSISIGNQVHGYQVQHTLLSGVPVEGGCTFINVPPVLDSFDVLEVSLNEKSLQFRNIPVTGS